MPRIVKEYDERRVDFLEATKAFFFTVGYEKMSVQKLTEQVGVAKGTFYHYFKSKEDLLCQWVIHEMAPKIESYHTVVNNPKLNALSKLSTILKKDSDWSLEHLDLLIALLKAMYTGDNIRLRAEISRQSAILSQPLFEEVIIQGVQEGSFKTTFPKEVSHKLPKIFDLYGEDLARIILNQHQGIEVQYEEAQRTVHVWQEIIERVLGAESQSIQLIDDGLLKQILKLIKKQYAATADINKEMSLQSV